jgi:hypothetical protein
MKKNILLMMLALVVSFVGCEPVTNSDPGVGTVITSLDQVKITVEAEVINGKAVNSAVVKAEGAVLCQWSDGINTLVSNEGSITPLVMPGTNTITLTAMAADGKIYTKEFTINVEEMHYPIPEEYGFLFGEVGVADSKTWTWNPMGGWPAPGGGPAGPIIMCAAAPSSAYDYWGWTPDYWANGDAEGYGAKMVFSLKGLSVQKYDKNGDLIASGTLGLNFTPNGLYNSKGTLTFNGTNILYPYDYNGNVALPGNVYTIVYLDEEHMMLHTPSANGGWYYVFNAVEE